MRRILLPAIAAAAAFAFVVAGEFPALVRLGEINPLLRGGDGARLRAHVDVLGAPIEAVSGREYFDFVRSEIYAPSATSRRTSPRPWGSVGGGGATSASRARGAPPPEAGCRPRGTCSVSHGRWWKGDS
jgi:CubicO group peptidase (beta-lactamase class C family)